MGIRTAPLWGETYHMAETRIVVIEESSQTNIAVAEAVQHREQESDADDSRRCFVAEGEHVVSQVLRNAFSRGLVWRCPEC